MSILKDAFGDIDARQQAKLAAEEGKLEASEKTFIEIASHPPVQEFLSDLDRLEKISNKGFKLKVTKEGETLEGSALRVMFGVSKLLEQYFNDKRNDGVLIIDFLPDKKMEIATDPATGRMDFDAVPQPVSREAMAHALSVYMEKQSRPAMLLGVRRKLGL